VGRLWAPLVYDYPEPPSFNTGEMEMEEGYEVLTIDCHNCHKSHQVKVNMEAYNQWKDGEALIQDALPELSAAERELLMSQTCGSCWDQLFGSDIDDMDDEESSDDIKDIHTEEIPEQEAVEALCDWIKEGADLDDLAKLYSYIMSSAGIVVRGKCGTLSDKHIDGDKA
jgi:hypothetical protein